MPPAKVRAWLPAKSMLPPLPKALTPGGIEPAIASASERMARKTARVSAYWKNSPCSARA